MKPSNAIVVGGGIGGLALATALARKGVAVTLLEQAARFSEIGAGLQISPNGLAVLRAFGLEHGLKARGAVRGQAVRLCDYAKGAQVARLDLTRLANDQRYYFLHRADLIDLLREAAQRKREFRDRRAGRLDPSRCLAAGADGPWRTAAGGVGRGRRWHPLGGAGAVERGG